MVRSMLVGRLLVVRHSVQLDMMIIKLVDISIALEVALVGHLVVGVVFTTHPEGPAGLVDTGVIAGGVRGGLATVENLCRGVGQKPDIRGSLESGGAGVAAEILIQGQGAGGGAVSHPRNCMMPDLLPLFLLPLRVQVPGKRPRREI